MLLVLVSLVHTAVCLMHFMSQRSVRRSYEAVYVPAASNSHCDSEKYLDAQPGARGGKHELSVVLDLSSASRFFT